jgi:hypothetical protein
MFAGITVAFLATALPFNLCWVYSHVLRNLTCGIWFVGVAHEFQAEISMNCSFEQGENVARGWRLGTGDLGLETGDWRLETGDWRHLEISRDTLEIH